MNYFDTLIQAYTNEDPHIWIPTLVNILEDSQAYYIRAKVSSK
jgi:hypothetical protein